MHDTVLPALGFQCVSSTLRCLRHFFAAPPKVLPFVIPKNLLVGERVNILCSAASGSKPLTFTWFKDDNVLRREGSVRVVDSSDYSTLNIEDLKLDHAGNYTCVVSNTGGTVSYSDALQVKGKLFLHSFVSERNTFFFRFVSQSCALNLPLNGE